MSLLSNLAKSFTSTVAKSAVSTYASFDPEGATDVEVRQYGDYVSEKADIAVRASNRYNELNAELTEKTARLESLKAGIKTLMGQEQTDAVKKAIDTGLNDAESLKADIKSLTDMVDQASKFSEDATNSHRDAVHKWEEAKQNLTRKLAEADNLKNQLDLSNQQKKDAERQKGLDSSFNSTSVISDSIDASNQKLKDQIAKNNITSGVLNESDSNTLLDAAIKGSEPTKSFEDRLKDL